MCVCVLFKVGSLVVFFLHSQNIKKIPPLKFLLNYFPHFFSGSEIELGCLPSFDECMTVYFVSLFLYTLPLHPSSSPEYAKRADYWGGDYGCRDPAGVVTTKLD